MVRNFPASLSWSTQDATLAKELTESKDGICILQDIGLDGPMSSIKNTFRKIYGDPNLAKRLNDVYPIRGIFKDGSFNLKQVDQKVPFDLSPSRLRYIVENDKELVKDLGEDFLKILSFYNCVQENIIPRLTRLAEHGISGCKMENDLMNIHQEMNYNYRLVDYYPTGNKTRRCGEHRDYGTFTLIFQDGCVGGLEVFSNGSWIPVAPNDGVVFLWGWSAAILSNGRIHAPLHRVVSVPENGNNTLAPQRNSAIFFVAPDLDVKLSPRMIDIDEELTYNPNSVRDLTVRDLKVIMGKTWRQREGTLTSEEQAELMGKCSLPTSQDDEIIAYLKKPVV